MSHLQQPRRQSSLPTPAATLERWWSAPASHIFVRRERAGAKVVSVEDLRDREEQMDLEGEGDRIEVERTFLRREAWNAARSSSSMGFEELTLDEAYAWLRSIGMKHFKAVVDNFAVFLPISGCMTAWTTRAVPIHSIGHPGIRAMVEEDFVSLIVVLLHPDKKKHNLSDGNLAALQRYVVDEFPLALELWRCMWEKVLRGEWEELGEEELRKLKLERKAAKVVRASWPPYERGGLRAVEKDTPTVIDWLVYRDGRHLFPPSRDSSSATPQVHLDIRPSLSTSPSSSSPADSPIDGDERASSSASSSSRRLSALMPGGRGSFKPSVLAEGLHRSLSRSRLRTPQPE